MFTRIILLGYNKLITCLSDFPDLAFIKGHNAETFFYKTFKEKKEWKTKLTKRMNAEQILNKTFEERFSRILPFNTFAKMNDLLVKSWKGITKIGPNYNTFMYTVVQHESFPYT
ncbi:hypothetical protein ACF0H5_001078 [Mactra antiquata]